MKESYMLPFHYLISIPSHYSFSRFASYLWHYIYFLCTVYNLSYNRKTNMSSVYYLSAVKENVKILVAFSGLATGTTYLFKLAEVVILPELLQIGDSLGVVETVVMVHLAISRQLTEL